MEYCKYIKAEGSNISDMREEAMQMMQDAISMSVIPKAGRKYRDDYVFDENKSVKWNREQVRKHNGEFDTERTRLRAARDEKIKSAKKMAVQYICEELVECPNDEYAQIVFEKAYERGLDRGGAESIFDCIDEEVEFLNKLFQARAKIYT